MKKASRHHRSTKSIVHHHIHHHYHHNDHPQPIYESRIACPVYEASPHHRHLDKNQHQNTESHSRMSEANEWKKHLNPEVTRLYDDFHGHRSRLSQKCPQVQEQPRQSEFFNPRKSHMLYPGFRSTTHLPTNSTGKLDELYNMQRSINNRQKQDIRSQKTGITWVQDNKCDQSYQNYQKELERLGRIQEECIYLRDRFYSHITRRHPEEMNQ